MSNTSLLHDKKTSQESRREMRSEPDSMANQIAVMTTAAPSVAQSEEQTPEVEGLQGIAEKLAETAVNYAVE